MVLFAMIFANVCLSGCGTRTVLVRPGEPIRIRAETKAKVWVADKNGKEVPGEVKIPEGWYALPDPGEKK
jgi:hypothetical protein